MSRAEKAPEIRLSIEEVSDLTGLKQHVLRYWENEFPPLRPERTRANQRLYKQKDVDLILTSSSCFMSANSPFREPANSWKAT